MRLQWNNSNFLIHPIQILRLVHHYLQKTEIYTGCNIENAAYTPTNCAERTAIFKAVSEGVREFDTICIVGGKDGILTEYTAPCGVCRQVMMEFCDPETFRIILAIDKEHYDIYTLKDLLPLGFGLRNLINSREI